MRKLMLFGAALLLAVGWGFYTAGQHALRHPESFLGRCATVVYHLGDPWFASRRVKSSPTNGTEVDAELDIAAGPRAVLLEPIEPIVVEASDAEPPLSQPRLPPEIAAAIERLRAAEESEPAKAFDVFTLTSRMPYADEGPEVLPIPQIAEADQEINLPGTYGFFILPPLQPVLDRLMEAVRMSGN